MIIIPFLQNSFAQGYKIGDLYESPDGSQGVVFFVFPNGQGGWVVALNDASNGCTWGSTADIHGLTNLNPQWSHQLLADTAGYTNTSIIRNFQNSNQYAAGVVDFENGWYLPSAAQLSLLYSQLPIISPIIVSLGGNDLADDSYWCSTEYSDGRAYQVNFGLNTPWTGLLSSANKSTLCHVRAVRSFSYSEDPISVSYSWSTGDTTPDITVSPDQTTIYTLTVTTAGGCVDTVQHTIVVNTPVTEEITQSVCESYEWNGQTYTESGEYTQTFTAANGCDSTVTLHLTVNYVSDSTINVSVMEDALPYILNGESYNTSGTYYQTLTNASGCDSTLTIVMSVITTFLPDNVDSANCVFFPDGTEWGIQTAWQSENIVSVLNTPLVGDLDGDGIPEIVCFARDGDNSTGDPRCNNHLLCLMGEAKQSKHLSFCPAMCRASTPLHTVWCVCPMARDSSWWLALIINYAHTIFPRPIPRYLIGCRTLTLEKADTTGRLM